MSDSRIDEDRRVCVTRLWSGAQPLVSAMITGAVFDFHDAEDLIAEVAEAAVRQFDDYDPSRPFVAWALGIARYVLLRYYGRRSAERHTYLDEKTLESLEAAHLEIADELPARQMALQECVKQIRGKSRRVFDMRYRHDLKPNAVAEVLGMSQNAVNVMLYRIRAALRDCIARRIGNAEQSN